MELKAIECRRCGAAIKYAPGVTHLKCEFCGTEYQLNRSADRDGGVRDIDYLGRGTLYKAYVPDGWDCRVFDDDQSFSRLAAICKGLRLDSPGGERLLFYPFAYYKGYGLEEAVGLGSVLKRNNAFDPVTLVRRRALAAPEDYAAERLRELYPNASDIKAKRLDDMDDFLNRRTAAFIAEAGQTLKKELDGGFGKYLLSFTLSGQPMNALFATVLAYRKKAEDSQAEPAREPEAQGGSAIQKYLRFGMSGGIIGQMKRGERVGIPGIKLPMLGELGGIAGPDWGRCFDAFLLSSGDLSSPLNTIFNDFCSSVRYGTLYYALQDEELRSVEQVQLQGAQQRQQNAFAASQRLRQTMNETSDIINSGYRERSATMDNVYRKASEAVRGVNTYTDSYGRSVEADVRYERVFQRGGDYAGSTSAGVDPGADWQELKRKD